MITLNFKWLLSFAIIFFLLFGLKFGAWLDLSNAVSILIIFFGLAKRQAIDKKSFSFLMILMLIATYTSFIIFFNGAFYDIWHFFQVPRLILNSLAIYFFVAFVSDMKPGSLERMLVGSMLLHSLIIILGMLVPEIREAIYDISGFQSKSDLRFAGLTQSYGITSVVHALGVLLVLFSNNLGYSLLRKVIYVSLLVSAQFFLARIGIVFSLIFILLKSLTRTRLSSLPAATVAGSLIIFGMISIFDYFSPEVQDSINHSLQLWFYFSEGREISSLETIQSFIFHNNSFFEYLFGTGHFGRGDQSTYLATDIAWAHMFSLGGFVYIFAVLFAYFYPIVVAKSEYSFILIVVTFVILISNYKEAFIFTRSISSVWFFIVFLHFKEISKKHAH